MTSIMKNISEDNSYYAKRIISSISKYKECLDKFSENFEKEVSLKTNTLLIIDTSVLLRYYSISFTAREKLYKFLTDNKDRIIITYQIQTEFLRNREDIIQRFFEQVTSKIPKEFNSEIINGMKGFLDKHKVVLKDYSFVEPGIEKYQAELEALLNKLNDAVELKKKEHKDLIVKDNLLNFLATYSLCEKLEIDELKIVKNHFDLLSKNITPEKVDSIISKPNGAFPGLGDIKEKPDDPYGDYIIFHEIMRHMMNKNINAIFLTFDNTKGDWMSKSKSPYLHYVQNVYANSGKILYIIDAERAFGELLNINIDSLVVSEKENYPTIITPSSLAQFANKSKAFSGAQKGVFDDRIIHELNVNGYNNMFEIEKDINKEEFGILQYRQKRRTLNTVGIMRCGLRIANPNYILQVENNWEINPITPSRLAEYRIYSNLKGE